MPVVYVVGEVSCQHGVVTWKIENFSSLEQTLIFRYYSPGFHFQDRRWKLRLYPHGDRKSSSKGYIGLYLYLDGDGTRIQLRYSLGIQAADGKTQVLWNSTDIFDNTHSFLGFPRIIQRSDLFRQSPEFLPLNVLTVTATLKDGGAIENGAEKLTQDIEKLWVSGEYSDVILKVKDVEFKAHRNILAVRSPVLRAMFQHDTTEKASGEVTIEDCEPVVFEQLLHYIYSGAPRVLNSENAAALYVVADKYLVSEVKALCVQCMKKELCLDTFCDYVTLSLMFNERELLETAVEYLSRNMIKVMRTVDWQRFLIEHSAWANDMLIRAAEVTKTRNGENAS